MRTNMKLTDVQEAQLSSEVAIGTRASSAYDGYIKDFIGRQNELLFKEFIESENLLDLPKLKEYQLAIVALEREVLADIETGQLALIQLNNKE